MEASSEQAADDKGRDQECRVDTSENQFLQKGLAGRKSGKAAEPVLSQNHTVWGTAGIADEPDNSLCISQEKKKKTEIISTLSSTCYVHCAT